MKTLSPRMKLDTQAKQYIIEAITPEGYNVPECDVMDTKGKLGFLYTTFKAEYGWSIALLGEVNAFKEWLQGLPSAINIAFTNYDILELAKAWGYYSEPMTEAQEQKVLDNWFNMIAVKAFQLFRKYGVI